MKFKIYVAAAALIAAKHCASLQIPSVNEVV